VTHRLGKIEECRTPTIPIWKGVFIERSRMWDLCVA
jgi:hypothetical protein